MRYPKPSAGRMQRAVVPVVQVGDGVAFPVLSIAGSGFAGVCGILGMVDGSILFGLLWLVPVLVGLIFLLYLTGTADIEGYDRRYIYKAERRMELIRGSDVEYLALPMYEKIFQHSQNHSYLQSNCTICDPRMQALSDLVPQQKRLDNPDDLERAREFLQIRKELES